MANNADIRMEEIQFKKKEYTDYQNRDKFLSTYRTCENK